MRYELRIYEPQEGRAEALRQRFEQHVLRIFPRHGIEVVGVFAPEPADGRLCYLTRFPDGAASEAAWARFNADAEWRDIKAASEREAGGPLMKAQSVTVLAALRPELALG
ncbi:NIPSNAP family protein [Roseomonas sp. E05]|uniref:NIPSNAP family protein n=1 Tax=Roseomonas sp. E05 TaxID=3046310 RepID=UPI0024BB6711|nr:NIPSNAP family protein [Roseomonas sp. E05]MDJ0391116.1 NIPSNAP family protein [Roseomonas sp. E05]